MSTSRTLQAAALAVACVAVPASRAGAQLTLGIGGGASIPVGALSNSNVTGYNALVQLGVGLTSWPVSLRVDGMFNQMNHKAGVPVGNLQLWTANANLVWNVVPLSGPGRAGIVPYVIAGAGYYNRSYHVSLGGGGSVGAGGNTHANDFGVNGGGGIKAGLASLSVFAEARYHYVFLGSGNHFQFVPITVGVIF